MGAAQEVAVVVAAAVAEAIASTVEADAGDEHDVDLLGGNDPGAIWVGTLNPEPAGYERVARVRSAGLHDAVWVHDWPADQLALTGRPLMELAEVDLVPRRKVGKDHASAHDRLQSLKLLADHVGVRRTLFSRKPPPRGKTLSSLLFFFFTYGLHKALPVTDPSDPASLLLLYHSRSDSSSPPHAWPDS